MLFKIKRLLLLLLQLMLLLLLLLLHLAAAAAAASAAGTLAAHVSEREVNVGAAKAADGPFAEDVLLLLLLLLLQLLLQQLLLQQLLLCSNLRMQPQQQDEIDRRVGLGGGRQ